jgi:hypothetical protein
VDTETSLLNPVTSGAVPGGLKLDPDWDPGFLTYEKNKNKIKITIK